MVHVDGNVLISGAERHEFATPEEAARRAAFINEALTWIGTPFVNCAAVKGPNGAVDCAGLLWRAAIDSGLLPEFALAKYSPSWMKHQSEEKFLDVLFSVGAREVEEPRVGDVLVFQVARTFAHGAILINSTQIVHAYAAVGLVLVSDLSEPALNFHPGCLSHIRRAVRYFEVGNA